MYWCNMEALWGKLVPTAAYGPHSGRFCKSGDANNDFF